MSSGVMKGDGVARARGRGRSRGDSVDLPTSLLARPGSSAGRDDVSQCKGRMVCPLISESQHPAVEGACKGYA